MTRTPLLDASAAARRRWPDLRAYALAHSTAEDPVLRDLHAATVRELGSRAVIQIVPTRAPSSPLLTRPARPPMPSSEPVTGSSAWTCPTTYYLSYVRRLFPALLSDGQERLCRLMGATPLPHLVLARTGHTARALRDATPDQLTAIATAHPELAAGYLPAENVRVATAHLN